MTVIGRRMITFLTPGRAYKRLLYFVLVWTCVCFVAFRVTFGGDGRHSWDDYFSSSHVSQNNRGLLQNSDYTLVTAGPSTDTKSVVVLDAASIPVGDPSVPLSDQEVLESLVNSSSNLPLESWARVWNKKSRPKSAPCRPEFPSLFELQYNNIYWQQLVSPNATFYLYGAYYDDRWRGGPLPMVRILAMVDRVTPPPTMCFLWFDEFSTPVVSPASFIYGWYPKWGNYADGHLQPYIITCKVPRVKGMARILIPSSVSIVLNKCDKITNNLKVTNHRPIKKERFAVCVKGLDFLYEDLSIRLIEWLELLRLLGASKVFLYDLEVHPNISKVLDFYQKEGLVEMTKITLPGNLPNLPGFRHLYLKKKLTDKRQNELIPYNDCLYRNLYSYEYLTLLDIDEVIMPLKHPNWSDMMDEVLKLSLTEKNYTRASYNFRNVYFLHDVANLDDNQRQSVHDTLHEPAIPPYLHMLQHVYRSRNYTKPGQYVKCFHNTERVVSLHNHFPLNCFGRCTTYSIGTDIAHLQHYRKDCVGPLRKSCKDFRVNTVRDTTIWRYKDALISRTSETLSRLHFIASSSPPSSSTVGSGDKGSGSVKREK